MNFAADIPVFLADFGELVTFLSASRFFTVSGIFSVNEQPIIPLDGEKVKPEYTLTCAAAEVADVTPLYTVVIRDVEYRVLAMTPNPVMATTEILLGHPS